MIAMGKLPELTKRARGARWRRPRSLFVTGAAFLTIVAVVGLGLLYKADIQSFFRSGHTITAEFGQNYQLYENETRVQLAGLEVGVVTALEPTDDGTMLVSMKVDDSAMDALGAQPSARVKPNTVLGGNYAIELKRGGQPRRFDGDVIPRSRTSTPQELDRILEALPRPARKSLQATVKQLDATLANGGSDAIRDLLKSAPSTLEPAGGVLKAAQGRRPGVDLPQLVTNVNSLADGMTRRSGQLEDIVRSLHATTTVLAEQSQPLADGIASMPPTLRTARAALVDLRGTVDRLTTTAHSLRPTVRAVDPLLQRLDPTLDRALPVLDDLRSLMVDAEPAVRQLVPVTQRATRTLKPLKGPVLKRVNGPIAKTLLSTWRGTGPYRKSGGGMQADHKFYEEIGYLVSNLDRASMTQDAQGATLGFQVGFNTRTVAGTPLTLPELIEQLQQAGGAR